MPVTLTLSSKGTPTPGNVPLVRYTTDDYPHLFEFDQLSWEDIAHISKTSDPSLYWKVGDFKTVDIEGLLSLAKFEYSTDFPTEVFNINDRNVFLDAARIFSVGDYPIVVSTSSNIQYITINGVRETLSAGETAFGLFYGYGIDFLTIPDGTYSIAITTPTEDAYKISLPLTIIGFNHDTVADPQSYGKQKAGLTLMLGAPRTIGYEGNSSTSVSPGLLTAGEWKSILGESYKFQVIRDEEKCTVTKSEDTVSATPGTYLFVGGGNRWQVTAPSGSIFPVENWTQFGLNPPITSPAEHFAQFYVDIHTIDELMNNEGLRSNDSFHTPNFVKYDSDTDTILSSFWETSLLREFLNSPAFISRLKTLIGVTTGQEFSPIPVKKYNATCWAPSTFYTASGDTSDQVFLLSENEVFGEQRFYSHDYDYPPKYLNEPLLSKKVTDVADNPKYTQTVLESCVSIDWKKLQKFIFLTRFHPTAGPGPNRSVYSKLLSEPFLWVLKRRQSGSPYKKFYQLYLGAESAAQSVFPNGQGLTATDLAQYGITDLGENINAPDEKFWATYGSYSYTIRIKLPYLNYSVAPAIEGEQYQLFKDGSSKFFWSSRYLLPSNGGENWTRLGKKTSILLLRSTDNTVQRGSSPNNASIFNGTTDSKGDVSYALQNATAVPKTAYDKISNDPYYEPINMDILPCFCL